MCPAWHGVRTDNEEEASVVDPARTKPYNYDSGGTRRFTAGMALACGILYSTLVYIQIPCFCTITLF